MFEEFVTPKRWEGKPLSFKWKFMWANYPEIGLLTVVLTVVGPLMAFYKVNKYPDSMHDAIKKYKYKYRVVRDDDPRIPEILAQKEKGKHFFPE